jgi:hypothetical protein
VTSIGRIDISIVTFLTQIGLQNAIAAFRCILQTASIERTISIVLTQSEITRTPVSKGYAGIGTEIATLRTIAE